MFVDYLKISLSLEVKNRYIIKKAKKAPLGVETLASLRYQCSSAKTRDEALGALGSGGENYSTSKLQCSNKGCRYFFSACSGSANRQ